MIQRKQTLFLLLTAILAIACVCVDPTWLDTLQAVTALLAGGTIFLYRKRLRQAQLCLFGLLTVVVWYIGWVVLANMFQTMDMLPMIEAVLLLLARKGIIDDEKLVRSADRIR